jgi:hypothetical protein
VRRGIEKGDRWTATGNIERRRGKLKPVQEVQNDSKLQNKIAVIKRLFALVS